jgi:hypothetical protein
MVHIYVCEVSHFTPCYILRNVCRPAEYRYRSLPAREATIKIHSGEYFGGNLILNRWGGFIIGWTLEYNTGK